MKLTLLALSAFLTTLSAHARMLSVELERTHSDRNYYVATAEACPGTFQSVIPQVKRVGAGEAIVALEPILDVQGCIGWAKPVRFLLNIDHDLAEQGLDPKTAKVFFQLQ